MTVVTAHHMPSHGDENSSRSATETEKPATITSSTVAIAT